MSDPFWNDLSAGWRASGRGPTPHEARVHVRRVERRVALIRTAVVLASVSGIAAALMHAANAIEALLGLGAGLALAIGWGAALLSERRTRAIAAAGAEQYVSRRSAILRAEVSAIRFVWLVLGVQLLFFVPWWIGGFAAHRDGMVSALGFYAFWLPAFAMVALLVWTLRRARSAAREAAALAEPS